VFATVQNDRKASEICSVLRISFMLGSVLVRVSQTALNKN